MSAPRKHDPPRRQRWHRAAAALAAAGLMGGVAVTAAQPVELTDAAWTDVELARDSIASISVQPPEISGCTNRGGIIGLLQYAEVSWNRVEGAVGYQVYFLESADSALSAAAAVSVGDETSIDISRGLLEGLVQGLLEILLGGGEVYVRVTSVHGSGWASQPSSEIQGIRSGLLSGIRCA